MKFHTLPTPYVIIQFLRKTHALYNPYNLKFAQSNLIHVANKRQTTAIEFPLVQKLDPITNSIAWSLSSHLCPSKGNIGEKMKTYPLPLSSKSKKRLSFDPKLISTCQKKVSIPLGLKKQCNVNPQKKLKIYPSKREMLKSPFIGPV